MRGVCRVRAAARRSAREGRGCVAHPKPVSQHRNQVEQERREGSVLSDLHEECKLGEQIFERLWILSQAATAATV